MVRGFLIPLGGFGKILFDAEAFGIKEREVLLTGSGTLFGGFAKPRGSLVEILMSTVAGFAGETDGNLCFGIALVGLGFCFIEFLREQGRERAELRRVAAMEPEGRA